MTIGVLDGRPQGKPLSVFYREPQRRSSDAPRLGLFRPKAFKLGRHNQQLQLEYQGGVGGYQVTNRHITICQVRRNYEEAFASYLHPGNTFFPTIDDGPFTQCKLKRVPANGAIKYGVVHQLAGVMHLHYCPRFGNVSAAHHQVHQNQPRFSKNWGAGRQWRSIVCLG